MKMENNLSTNIFNIMDLRVLHFEKLMPLHATSEPDAANPNKHTEAASGNKDNSKKRIYQKFCSLGYYDQMSYVRAEDADSILDYKHCFLIKYPYQKGGQRIMADQMFTLIQKAPSSQGYKNSLHKKGSHENDPFEADAANMPFLGIILVTVGRLPSDGQEDSISVQQGQPTDIYQEIVAGYTEKITGGLDERMRAKNDETGKNRQTFCYDIFYTPNCADLCIAIRTDTLQDIYDIKEGIAAITTIERNNKPNTINVFCHTTSYTLFQLPDSRCWSAAGLVERNKDIFIELRLSGSMRAMKELSDALPKEHGMVYGITGNGQISLELDFETFVSIYPYIWEIKSGMKTNLKNIPSGINDYEAENNATKNEAGEKATIKDVFCKNASQLTCSYIRVKYGFRNHRDDTHDSCVETSAKKYDEGFVKKYEKKVYDFIEKNPIRNILQKGHIKEQKSLLKELFYTYNDFWFRQSAWWKGIVFYAQLECIMRGVEQYEQLAGKLPREEDSSAIIRRVCGDIGQAIFCVNNFNKLLQSVNQYVLNIPNYEMQTKVNIEKYLMAYTMYLFEISNNYYYNPKESDRERILPFLVLDFNATRIEAHTLFDSITVLENAKNKQISDGKYGKMTEKSQSQSTSWTSLVAVRCPNYQWFANVFQVLPMITHEISHNLRYLDRKERNNTLIKLLIKHVSKYIMEQLINRTEPDYTYSYYRYKERFFLESIENLIETKGFGNDRNLNNVRLKDLGNYFLNSLLNVMGLRTEEKRKNEIYDRIYRNMLKIFQTAKIPYLVPDDITDTFIKNKQEKAGVILFNILLDLLQSHRKPEQWKKKASMFSTTEEYDVISEFLENYGKCDSILTRYILAGLPDLVDAWINYSPEIRILASENKQIENYLNALKKRQIRDAWKAFEEYVSSSKSNQEIKYWEELHNFCQYYGNIVNTFRHYKMAISVEEKTPQFAEELYSTLHKNYQDTLKDRNNPKNAWVKYNVNQKLLVSLGVTNSSPSQFAELYYQTFCGTSEIQLEKMIYDQMDIYEEIFADLGMCEAFQFSAFGYFMYCIHIFMKEREVPIGKLKNLNADRVRILLLSKYKAALGKNAPKLSNPEGTGHEHGNSEKAEYKQANFGETAYERRNFEGDLNNYWNDIRNRTLELIKAGNRETAKKEEDAKKGEVEGKDSMRPKLEDTLNRISDFRFLVWNSNVVMDMIKAANSRKQKELSKQLEMLRWAVIFYKDLELESERASLEKENDSLIKELCKCIINVREKLQKEDWIKRCHQNTILQKISSYYNNYSYSNAMQANQNGNCLDCQNMFVFKYYANMFNCIQSVKSKLDQQKNSESTENTEPNILDCLFEDKFSEIGGTAND